MELRSELLEEAFEVLEEAHGDGTVSNIEMVQATGIETDAEDYFEKMTPYVIAISRNADKSPDKEMAALNLGFLFGFRAGILHERQSIQDMHDLIGGLDGDVQDTP